MRTVLAVECGEGKTAPVAGVVIFVENDLKNLGCSCYQFKICCRFSKLVYFMLFESISKIPGLFVGPTGRARGRLSTASAVSGSLADSLVLVRGAPVVGTTCRSNCQTARLTMLIF